MYRHCLLSVWSSIAIGSICVGAIADDRDPSAPLAQAAPQWIWRLDTCADTDVIASSSGNCRLERRFAVNRQITSAVLTLACDFCTATVALNGERVLTMEPYCQSSSLDVARAIKTGANDIAISAEAVAGPAALALSLLVTYSDGTQDQILSDGQWMAFEQGVAAPSVPASAASMGHVSPELWGVGRRPATIDPFDNYEQWRQAAGASADRKQPAFWTAPGFEISVVRSARPEEGSWVSMAFDPQGRITIAREDQGLLRMTLDRTGQSVAKVETINDDLLECRGLLYAHGSLYANANNSKGLYRLRDRNADGQFDEVTLLRQFPGGVGHGRNDLALGPDGKIYLIHGDSVDMPADNIVDRTSPLREARRGKKTQEGHLVRTDAEGKEWELVCAGLRNPFGIAFDSRGDLFTYDADAEFDMGTPWYRPTRIVQLVSGADYGWRGVTGVWPPYFPDHADNALPTLDIGKGSPTAVLFGSQTRFPDDYQRAMFVLDWAYGRILAVHLAPRGAGYRAHAETFLKGRPLNVTDLAVGPDGALYLVTGGRKTQSALYRIDYTGGTIAEFPVAAHELACQVHATASRKLRQRLEQSHCPMPAAEIDELWPHLASSDPMIQHAARIAIEHQPHFAWRERAFLETNTTAALNALLAVARTADKESARSAIDRLASLKADRFDTSQWLMLLQAYTLCGDSSPEALQAKRVAILAKLEAAFPPVAAKWLHVSHAGTGAVVRRELARHLTQLGSPLAPERIAQELFTSPAQEDLLMGLFLLRGINQGWHPQSRRTYFRALNDATKFVSGEGMPRFLAQIREESLKSISDAERNELMDVLSDSGQSVPEELPPPRPTVKKWTPDDLKALYTESKRSGDATRGAAVFRDALCVRCHRAGARGPAVGPDLTHVAGRFSRRDMLESILNPSKVVAENYRNVQVRTTDGRAIVGRLLVEGDYRSERVRIATDPLRSATMVELSKQEIEEYGLAETSPMPQGLLDSFRVDEIGDLLEFLERGGGSEVDPPR